MSEMLREKLKKASKLSEERRKKEIGDSKTLKQDEYDNMFKVGIIFVLFFPGADQTNISGGGGISAHVSAGKKCLSPPPLSPPKN